jgi:hypothetical protein
MAADQTPSTNVNAWRARQAASVGTIAENVQLASGPYAVLNLRASEKRFLRNFPSYGWDYVIFLPTDGKGVAFGVCTGGQNGSGAQKMHRRLIGGAVAISGMIAIATAPAFAHGSGGPGFRGFSGSGMASVHVPHGFQQGGKHGWSGRTPPGWRMGGKHGWSGHAPPGLMKHH